MSILAGANTRIVATLREYGPVPKEFLASLLGRTSEEISGDLEELQGKGILEFRGDKVQLAPEKALSGESSPTGSAGSKR